MTKSDWSKWSAIAEILSAIAIVITLVYLSVQTRHLAAQTEQNNELLRAQAGYNMLQNRSSYREDIVRDPEVAEFWLRVNQAESLSDLSEVDVLRARMEVQRRFLSLQWEYGQIIDGNLDLQEFNSRLEKDGPVRQEWELFKRTLRPDFVEWYEGLPLADDQN